MDDLALIRIEKQLGACNKWLLAIVREAEAWSDQSLADALFDSWCDLKVVHDKVSGRRRPSARRLAA